MIQFIIIFLICFFNRISAQDQDISLLRDNCNCYCCPSSSNSDKTTNCNLKDPPLTGSVPIFGPRYFLFILVGQKHAQGRLVIRILHEHAHQLV